MGDNPVSNDPKNVGGFLVRRVLAWERDFTQIPNAYLRDKRLSLKARGILGELMSHRDGHEVSLQSIAEDGQDGLSAVRSGVNELEYHGYLVRENVRVHGGRYGTRWELIDPTEPLFQVGDNSAFENRTRSATASENRTRSAFENRMQERTPPRRSKTSQGELRPAHQSVENDASGAPHAGFALAAGPRCSAKPQRYRDRSHHYEPSGYCTFCTEHESQHATAPRITNPSTGEVA